MADAFDAFCNDGPGKADLHKTLLEIWRGFAADGEKAEPLAAEFARATGVAPRLRVIQRCNMHAMQKSMEDSLKSNMKIKRILELLVSNYSEGRSDAKGALCRALKNSDKLRNKFGSLAQIKLQEVQQALETAENVWRGPQNPPCGKHAMSSAPQRFDSILVCLRTIILNYLAVLEFVVELPTEATNQNDDCTDWSMQLQELFLEEEFEALLPAAAEFLEIGIQELRISLYPAGPPQTPKLYPYTPLGPPKTNNPWWV